jgi:hypothetical protein
LTPEGIVRTGPPGAHPSRGTFAGAIRASADVLSGPRLYRAVQGGAPHRRAGPTARVGAHPGR